MKFWPPILGFALCAGCAHYQSQPISPEKTAAQLEARRLDDPRLKKFLEQNSGREFQTWPRTNWNLAELTLVAFDLHPSLAVAREQWMVAIAGLKTAGARPNPSMTVAPGFDNGVPGNYSPWFVSLTYDVPIETAGKRGKRIAEAEKNAESARWNFASAAWQIRAGVRANLLDFLIAGRRVALLQKQLALQNQVLQRLRQRFEAGAISRPESSIALIALNQTELDLGQARSLQAEVRSRLAEAIGLPEAALDGQNLNFDFSPSEVSALTSSEARRIALRSRADVLAALADYAATEADLRLQIAMQYPDLHMGPGYAWNANQAGDNQWTLGVTLELPILNQNQGPIAEATARRKLSAAKFMELQSKVIGQIDRAVSGFRVAFEQLQTEEKLAEAERQQQKSIEAQIKSGLGDRLDLATSQLELNNTALAQLDSEAKMHAAFGALEDALQRPVDALSSAIDKIAAPPRSLSSK